MIYGERITQIAKLNLKLQCQIACSDAVILKNEKITTRRVGEDKVAE